LTFDERVVFYSVGTEVQRPFCVRPIYGTMEVVQGYLARRKTPLHKTLQLPYAWGPMVFPGDVRYLVSEVPL